MIRQYVVFGDFAVNRAFDGKWKELKQLFEDSPNSIGKREFATEEERIAYLNGLADATGWMECYPLEPEEVRKMSRQIKLSEIYNLAGNI